MAHEINTWINRIIKGSGGFEQWEDREAVIFHHSREEGIAEFVIRCLANPRCEGSAEVIEAIIQQRQKIAQPCTNPCTASDWKPGGKCDVNGCYHE